MKKKYRHLTWEDRLYLERLTKQKYSKREIAGIIGCSLATIYNELKRVAYEHLKSDLTTEVRYSPQKAYITYKAYLKQKGRTPKLEADPELRKYISDMIKGQNFSPEAVLFEIRANNLTFVEEVKSVQTIYSGIRKGLFKDLTMKDMPRHGKSKQKKQRVEKLPAYLREQKGKSIAERPKEVVKALNRLEKKLGSAFYKIFNSITVDNGSEFKDFIGMEKALRRKRERTSIYYCNPRSPNERGSNENANILLRRFSGLEKGSDFDRNLTYKTCKAAQFWVNTYPRGIFNGKCSMELFYDELIKLGIAGEYEL